MTSLYFVFRILYLIFQDPALVPFSIYRKVAKVSTITPRSATKIRRLNIINIVTRIFRPSGTVFSKRRKPDGLPKRKVPAAVVAKSCPLLGHIIITRWCITPHCAATTVTMTTVTSTTMTMSTKKNTVRPHLVRVSQFHHQLAGKVYRVWVL